MPLLVAVFSMAECMKGCAIAQCTSLSCRRASTVLPLLSRSCCCVMSPSRMEQGTALDMPWLYTSRPLTLTKGQVPLAEPCPSLCRQCCPQDPDTWLHEDDAKTVLNDCRFGTEPRSASDGEPWYWRFKSVRGESALAGKARPPPFAMPNRGSVSELKLWVVVLQTLKCGRCCKETAGGT